MGEGFVVRRMRCAAAGSASTNAHVCGKVRGSQFAAVIVAIIIHVVGYGDSVIIVYTDFGNSVFGMRMAAPIRHKPVSSPDGIIG